MKRLLKDVISEIGFFAGGDKLSQALKNPACRILMYHAVEEKTGHEDKMGLSVAPKMFSLQMHYLKDNGFNVIGFADLVGIIKAGKDVPCGSVVITFDDGYQSIADNALPVLEECGFTATLFVNIFFIEKRIPKIYYWHNWEVLDWNEIKDLSSAGMLIGSHGFSHRRLAGLSYNDSKEEALSSKKAIEEKIGRSVDMFSYPNGSFSSTVKRALKDSGYNSACSSLEGASGPGSDLFALNRAEITFFDDDLHKFEKKLFGYYDWLGKIKRHD